jgi:uncharacterized protein (DUF1684 family)
MDAPRRLLLSAALVVSAASVPPPTVLARLKPLQQAPPGYAGSIAAWRVQREAALRKEDGWLTLVGLSWLEEGENRIGSDPSSEVPLPHGSAPRSLGVLTLARGTATFKPAPGAAVRVNGRPARTQVLRPQPGTYDVVTSGTVTLFVIKRGDRIGVRVKDSNSPARRNFPGLHFYPIREGYRVAGRFTPHAAPATIMIPNVLGAVEAWPTPGTVTFTLGGRDYTLQPVLDGPDAKELFFIFRDLTTGDGTYPGGRFLYASMPVNGEVLLDFNKAENPPCAFTPYATCPVPPKENALPVRIEAGERDPHR